MWFNVLGEYADLAIYDVVDELLDMVSHPAHRGTASGTGSVNPHIPNGLFVTFLRRRHSDHPHVTQIKPKDPPCITAEDLRVSGMSGIFFSVLADAKQFRDYNYRENTMHQDDNEQ